MDLVDEKIFNSVKKDMTETLEWNRRFQLPENYKSLIDRRTLPFREKYHLESKCIRASQREYELWLYGYLRKPNTEITHVYDYSLPSDFYIAIDNICLPTTHGAESFNMIIPEEFKAEFTYDDPGHSHLFFMKDFFTYGSMIFVPYYKKKG